LNFPVVSKTHTHLIVKALNSSTEFIHVKLNEIKIKLEEK